MIHSPRPPVGSPTLHLTLAVLVLLFASALALSIVMRVEIVARGEGRVVPLSRVQVVQPEFGGRIHEIRVENGARVAAGDPLVLLDPTDARAELARREAEEARLISERARLEAFPAERFGHVAGRVASVSADAVETPDGRFVFVARVVPDAPALVTPSGSHRLRAGMTAQVDVVTGDRRLIGYFFEPIVRALQESLGER